MIPWSGLPRRQPADETRPTAVRRTWWWALRRLAWGSAAERRMIRYRLAEIAARVIGDCWVPEDLKLWEHDPLFWRGSVSKRSHRAAESGEFSTSPLLSRLDSRTIRGSRVVPILLCPRRCGFVPADS
jgi:hypothetical protein